MLLLALSCLQGRPQASAARELLALGADGLQLTPGNAPDAALDAILSETPHVRTHQGFSRKALRERVWGEDGALRVICDSVHAPPVGVGAEPTFWQRWEEGCFAGTAIETMYPGHLLGDGAALDRAMRAGYVLALDVSHLYLQRCAGVLDDRTLQRALDYDAIAEVHVSANDGRGDQHRPLTEDTFGLAWARARLQAGTPVVFESYLHRVTEDARRRQVELLLR